MIRAPFLEVTFSTIITQAKKDLSELSELIDRLNDDIRLKQANLDEMSETVFLMEDSVEQHVAVKKHDHHIIQQLQRQISELKVRYKLTKPANVYDSFIRVCNTSVLKISFLGAVSPIPGFINA